MRGLKRASRLAGTLFLALLLGACSHALQSARLQDDPPAGLPLQHELKDTPFFAQQRYHCGPAALATVLVQRGLGVMPEALAAQVYLPGREGSLAVEMDAAARRHGMLAYPLEAQMESILREIAAGNPVLVLQNLGLNWLPQWHYAVVVGYDLGDGDLILRSGLIERYVVSMDVFETTWRRGDYWARVLMPPGQLPATAQPLTYLQANLDLEETSQPEAALQGYRSATAAWPEVAVAWLARGNLAYQQGLDDEAVQSFSLGLRVTPDDAALWNNLGYALARKGCGAQALAAIHCALSLAPNQPAYRESLRELQAAPETAADCETPACPGASEDHVTAIRR
ncbi:MAG: PA2778 family cysteine peptidase [Pseudomonadota bacterium]